MRGSDSTRSYLLSDRGKWLCNNRNTFESMTEALDSITLPPPFPDHTQLVALVGLAGKLVAYRSRSCRARATEAAEVNGEIAIAQSRTTRGARNRPTRIGLTRPVYL